MRPFSAGGELVNGELHDLKLLLIAISMKVKTSRNSLGWILIAGSLVAAIYFFSHQEPKPEPRPVSLPTSLLPTPAPTGNLPPIFVIDPASLEGAVREVVQSVLKQELASYRPPTSVAPSARPPAVGSVMENSPSNAQALAHVSGVVDAAIASGVWTQDDTKALAPYAGQLTAAQQEKILNEFGDAINQQRLKLKGSLPVF